MPVMMTSLPMSLHLAADASSAQAIATPCEHRGAEGLDYLGEEKIEVYILRLCCCNTKGKKQCEL